MALTGPVLGQAILSLGGAGSAPVAPPVFGGGATVPRGYPHVTIWSDFAANGGVPLRRVAAWLEWQEAHAIEEFLVTHRFQGSMPSRWEGAGACAEGRVLRVVRAPGVIREYEITAVTDGLREGGVTGVAGQGLEFLLATMGSVPSLPADTVANVLAGILASAYPWMTLSTVTPTLVLEPEETDFAGASVGQAVRQVLDAVYRRTHQRYEAWLERPDESTCTLLVGVHGGSAPQIDLPFGVALQGIRRTRSLATRMTRGFDPSAGVADSYWLAGTVTGTTVEVEDLAGGLGLAVEADQFNTTFGIRDMAGTVHVITDTEVLSPTLTRLTMASTSGISAGALVVLVQADGSPVASIPLPSAEALLPRPLLRPVASGAPAATNLCPNPVFRFWTGSGPIGYTGTGLSTSRATIAGSWLAGGASCQLDDDMDRSVGRTLAFFAPDALGSIHYTVRFKPVRNSQWALLTWKDPATGGDVSEAVPLLDNGRFHEITRSFVCPAGPVTLQQIMINNGGGMAGERASLYVDAFGMAWAPGAPGFLEGSGPASAIQAINRALLGGGVPQVSYEVRPLDLAKRDPTGAGKYRVLTLGGQARVIADPLGVRDTVRVVEHTEPGRGLAAVLTLATRAHRVSELLARLAG